MTFDPILKKTAELVEHYLPEGHPLQGRVTPALADAKDLPGNTWAVVELVGTPRDLVEGNFTMQATARVAAQIVPTEGGWSAESLRAFGLQLWLTVSRAVEELSKEPTGEHWQLLQARVTTPCVSEPVRAVGYEMEVGLQLTVQF